MKVRALVFRLRNGETHVLVDTLNESHLRDSFARTQQVFPETIPAILDLDLALEQHFLPGVDHVG